MGHGGAVLAPRRAGVTGSCVPRRDGPPRATLRAGRRARSDPSRSSSIEQTSFALLGVDATGCGGIVLVLSSAASRPSRCPPVRPAPTRLADSITRALSHIAVPGVVRKACCSRVPRLNRAADSALLHVRDCSTCRVSMSRKRSVGLDPRFFRPHAASLPATRHDEARGRPIAVGCSGACWASRAQAAICHRSSRSHLVHSGSTELTLRPGRSDAYLTGTSPAADLFPSETVVGVIGPTLTGIEPFAIATAPAAFIPKVAEQYPLFRPTALNDTASSSSSSSLDISRYWGNLSPFFSVPSSVRAECSTPALNSTPGLRPR